MALSTDFCQHCACTPYNCAMYVLISTNCRWIMHSCKNPEYRMLTPITHSQRAVQNVPRPATSTSPTPGVEWLAQQAAAGQKGDSAGAPVDPSTAPGVSPTAQLAAAILHQFQPFLLDVSIVYRVIGTLLGHLDEQAKWGDARLVQVRAGRRVGRRAGRCSGRSSTLTRGYGPGAGGRGQLWCIGRFPVYLMSEAAATVDWYGVWVRGTACGPGGYGANSCIFMAT